MPEWKLEILRRLAPLRLAPTREVEIADELAQHLDDRYQELLASGQSEDVAYRTAIDELMDEDFLARGLRPVERNLHREPITPGKESNNIFSGILQDFRYALRMLRKSPAFTTVAILTLALGIGANTAIFSVVDAVLLKPLRFKNPSSLAIVWENQPKAGLLRNVTSPANLFDWEQQNHVFSEMAAFWDAPANLTGPAEPQQVDAELVSPNFFSVLGVNPELGRGFSPEEDHAGKNHVVVLSYGLWKSKFAEDPNVLGKTLELDGESYTVIGVTGADFDWYITEFSFTHERPQIWAPLETSPTLLDRSKTGRFLRVVARLKPGVSLAQAQSQMDVIAAGLAGRYPDYNKGWGVTLVSLRDQLSGALRPALLILFGAVGLVLLIACANISSLLLSRAAGRRHEFAIRVALGASRARIARQFLAESVLLATVGGVLGAFVTVWATGALVRAGSGSLMDSSGVSINWRVLAFAFGLTLLAGLLAGFLPSFMASRAEVASALAEGGRTSSPGRRGLAARTVFVVVEIGLAVALLAGSSLLIRSFFRLTEVNPGFHTSHVLTFRISLPDKYQQGTAAAAFFGQLLDKIRVLPGVSSTSAEDSPPFSGVLGSRTGFQILGEPPLPPSEQHDTDVRVIEPGYFRTISIPLLRGRTFNPSEFAQASDVVIINEAFVERYFPGRNPLGQKLVIDMKDKNPPSEIVGVVGDVHETSLSAPSFPTAYWPYPELPRYSMTFVVRTATPPLSLVAAIRDALQQIDKDQPIAKISTMDQLVSNSVARSRFTMLLLSAFAGLALVLACVGIYEVMAYSVAQRTHEIGIRLALGAQRIDVLRLVLEQGVRLALLGVGIGVAGALLLTRLMTTLLYGVGVSDPLTFAAVPILLMLVALLACYIPARRAMRVDPMVALRYE